MTYGYLILAMKIPINLVVVVYASMVNVVLDQTFVLVVIPIIMEQLVMKFVLVCTDAKMELMGQEYAHVNHVTVLMEIVLRTEVVYAILIIMGILAKKSVLILIVRFFAHVTKLVKIISLFVPITLILIIKSFPYQRCILSKET